jgi:adenosylmethionine-8-amino-7-oxononanoate aminotransferase
MGALGLSGHKSRREIFEPSLPQDTAFISPCYEYRDMEQGMSNKDYVNKLAQELENKILEFGPKKVAGFFAEPVVGAVNNPKHATCYAASSLVPFRLLTWAGTRMCSCCGRLS